MTPHDKKSLEKFIHTIVSIKHKNSDEIPDFAGVSNLFFDILNATDKMNTNIISSKGKKIFDDLIKHKIPVIGKRNINYVGGLSGVGKTFYIKNFCAKDPGYIPYFLDRTYVLCGIDALNQFLPIRINNNEEKHPSFYSALNMKNMFSFNYYDDVKISSIKDFGKLSTLAKTNLIAYGMFADTKPEYNFNIMYEANILQIIKNLANQENNKSLTLLAIPDRIREANILHRYEKSLFEHNKFLNNLSSIMKTNEFYEKSYVPTIANNIPKGKFIWRALQEIPVLCAKNNIPCKIINPLSGKNVKSLITETTRKMDINEREYFEQTKDKINDYQNARNAGAYYRICLKDLDRK